MNDIDLIRQIINDDIAICTPIIGKGQVNRVYSVNTKNNRIIVRLNEQDELPRFRKEAWCLEMADKVGVPSPKIIDIGTRQNTAFMVISFVAGKNGSEIIENKEQIWKTIGSYANKIHSISTSRFGEDMTELGTFRDKWERYLSYNIDSLNSKDKLLQLKTITEKQSEEIKDRFIKLRETIFKFGLIHGDLSLENVIVQDDKVTLIDWGGAGSSIIPHMEIVDLFQNMISEKDKYFDCFLQGYGMDRKEYEFIKPEIETLNLLQAIDKLRWAIDRSPDKIEEFSQRVKSLIEG